MYTTHWQIIFNITYVKYSLLSIQYFLISIIIIYIVLCSLNIIVKVRFRNPLKMMCTCNYTVIKCAKTLSNINYYILLDKNMLVVIHSVRTYFVRV